jgi:hypothetical protein
MKERPMRTIKVLAGMLAISILLIASICLGDLPPDISTFDIHGIKLGMTAEQVKQLYPQAVIEKLVPARDSEGKPLLKYPMTYREGTDWWKDAYEGEIDGVHILFTSDRLGKRAFAITATGAYSPDVFDSVVERYGDLYSGVSTDARWGGSGMILRFKVIGQGETSLWVLELIDEDLMMKNGEK